MQNFGQNTYSFYSASKPIHFRGSMFHTKRNVMILSLLLIVAALSIISIILCTVWIPPKSSQYSSAPNKYFKSVQIEKGDTLWSIAKENMDTEHYKNISEYVKEIKKINALVSDRVTAGNYIIIPYYSTD